MNILFKLTSSFKPSECLLLLPIKYYNCFLSLLINDCWPKTFISSSIFLFLDMYTWVEVIKKLSSIQSFIATLLLPFSQSFSILMNESKCSHDDNFWVELSEQKLLSKDSEVFTLNYELSNLWKLCCE